MLVAVTGIRVHLRAVRKRTILRFTELNSPLRIVLYAGEAELAVTGHLHAPRCQFVVATRTHIGTDAAIDTGVCHGETFFALHQEPHFRIELSPLHESLVHLPFLLRYRFVPMPPSIDVRRYLLQILRDMLIHLDLLVHVEIGQPIIHP